MTIFRRIGLALAFSPTAEAILSEASRLVRLFHAELILLHVGHHGDEEERLLSAMLEKIGVDRTSVKVVWQEGDPARRILTFCQEEKISLLVAGALKRENLVQHYVGTIARTVMRKADCSLMMLVSPGKQRELLKNIVVNAEDSPFVEDALQAACEMATHHEQAWIHVVRELKLYGLAMAVIDQHSEQQYAELQHHLLQDEITEVERMLLRIPHDHVKINVKMLSGKSGFELNRFAARKQADLLVVGGPSRRFFWFDRLFTHDLEYVFADLPCNLLIVNPGKEALHG